MNAVDSSPFRESPDLFEVEATNGMPRASIDKLPESWITEEYRRDAVGDLSGCSVCLQVGSSGSIFDDVRPFISSVFLQTEEIDRC
jgi:hypothetical protein